MDGKSEGFSGFGGEELAFVTGNASGVNASFVRGTKGPLGLSATKAMLPAACPGTYSALRVELPKLIVALSVN